MVTVEKDQPQKTATVNNKERVIDLLMKGPKKFKLLHEESKLSQMGLWKILNTLLKEGKIEKVLLEGKVAYGLTEKGRVYHESIWFLMHELVDLKNQGYGYARRPYGAGIRVDMAYPPNSLNVPSIYQSIPTLRELFLRQLLKSAEKIPEQGRLILSFEMDYSGPIRQILRFKEDILKNEDIFLDPDLRVSGALDLRFLAESARLFDDEELTKKVGEYLKGLTTDKEKLKTMIEHYEWIDITVLNRFIEDIEKDKDPLDDAEIKDKLMIKLAEKGVLNLIPEYLEMSWLLKYPDKKTIDKLNEFEIKSLGMAGEIEARLQKAMQQLSGALEGVGAKKTP
jgi:hypothetical protein